MSQDERRSNTRRPFGITSIVYALAAVALLVVLLPRYGEILRPSFAKKAPDFFQDWASARNHLEGLPVYAPQKETIPRYLGRAQSQEEADIEYNAHPPFSVLLALPAAWAGLGLSDAALAWNLASLTAFALALGTVARRFPDLKPLFVPIGLLLPFCVPVYTNFLEGQPNLVLAFLITMAWALDRAERPISAGACVGLAAAIKLFPAFLVVYFLARKRWRAVFAMALVFLTANLAAALVLGGRCYVDYGSIVLPTLAKFQRYGFNLSIAGAWFKLLDPAAGDGPLLAVWSGPALARLGTLACDLLIAGLVAHFARRAATLHQRDLAFGLTITAMLLASPIAWVYTLPVLLVPIALLLRAALRSPRLLAVLAPALIVLALPPQLMLEFVTFGRPPEQVPTRTLLIGVSLGFFALIALFALGALQFRARTEGQPAAEAQPASVSAFPCATN